MKLLGSVLIAAALALPAAGATPVTVRQLFDTVTSEAAHSPDEEIAHKIAAFELTERLTERTLAGIRSSVGPHTREILEVLADKSAFFDPPGAEILLDSQPSVAEQHAILARAGDYTFSYVSALPNFICTRQTRRFDDDRFRQPRKWERRDQLRSRDFLTADLTYDRGSESASTKTATGNASADKQPQGLKTWGEFGGLIGMLFMPATATKVVWSHWEVFDGKRVAVFNYSADAAHSKYTVSSCCTPIWGPDGRLMPFSITTAVRGALFIEPGSGTILRATLEAVNIPVGYPVRKVNTVVEYGSVDIGGRSHVVLVRSVTLSDTLMPPAVPRGIPEHLHALNDIAYTRYRKFGSESRLVAGDAPPSDPEVKAPVETALPVAMPEVKPELDAVKPVAPPPDESGHPVTPPLIPPAPAPVQTTATPPPAPPPPPADRPPTFTVRANVVTVRAVVRDSKGRVIGDLRKEDFRLLDAGKEQVISGFAIDRALTAHADLEVPQPSASSEAQPTVTPAAVLPDRHIVLFFDDRHLAFADISQTRAAALRVLNDAMDPGTRVAIYTTSGRIALDFTTDRALLEKTLNRITPERQSSNAANGCPHVSYYMADMIVNQSNTEALTVKAVEAEERCAAPINRDSARSGVTGPSPQAIAMARLAARSALNQGDAETLSILSALQTVVRRLAVIYGQRSVVLISPGFVTPSLEWKVNDEIDRAARSGVVVNVMDARGLYAPAGFDVETRSLQNPIMQRLQEQYNMNEQRVQSNVLVQLADGTGGTIFQNSNDLYGGFKRVLTPPEVSYILGFSPQDLKADGKYHELKVQLKDRRGLEVQARKGYFAPKEIADSALAAKQEIENAVFSRDQMSAIPTIVQARAEGRDGKAKITVVTRIDIRPIQFHKRNGHNMNMVVGAVNIFDSDGKFVKGVQDEIGLDFTDEKLAARMASGIMVKNEIDVPTGSYLVRVVLRDEDGQMSMTNTAVRTP